METAIRSSYIILLVASQLLCISLADVYPPLQNFTQLVDHSGSSNATFQQRYQLDITNFRPGGPILLFQGPEVSLEIDYLQYWDFFDDAVELNGISAAIEHRFFGTSFPPGFDGSAASYATLTLENVLLDGVSFVKWIRSSVPGAENSPVFIESGSYGGFLSAMARIRHPKMFYGAFCSSGPVKSFGPWPNNTAKFEVYDWVSNFYYDVSFNAAEKIKSAMIVLDQCSQNGTCATAINFNLCGPQLNTTDYRNLYTSLLDLYKRIPQYSFPWVELLPVDAILELINLTEAANSTAEVLEAPMQIHNFATTDLSQCTNWTNASFTLGATRAGSWGWITCNYNIVNQWSIGENNIMPAKDDTGRVEICLVPEWAGPMSNWTNEEWIDWNGFSDEQLTKTERLLFIGGQYGPFSAISLPNLPVSSDRNAARSILVDGLGHGGDMAGTYVLPKGVSANLDMIQDTKLEYLKKWIETYDLSLNSSNSTTRNNG